MGGVIFVSAAPAVPGVSEYWSPYYRITHVRLADERYGAQVIHVNGIPHQNVWDLNDPRKEPFYEQVYRWFPDRTFENVLIVGAGNGVDVAVALAHGAAHVDAVEIDPKIADIGRAENHQQPYSDPRVDLPAASPSSTRPTGKLPWKLNAGGHGWSWPRRGRSSSPIAVSS